MKIFITVLPLSNNLISNTEDILKLNSKPRVDKNVITGGYHRMVSEKSELTTINGPHILHDDFGLKYITFFISFK